MSEISCDGNPLLQDWTSLDYGVVDNYSSLLALIRGCGTYKNLQRGSNIHAALVKTGLLQNDIYLTTAFISMYAKCGLLGKAQELFVELPAPDVASWNALISAYAQQGLGEEALKCFRRMQVEDVIPNAATFVSVLKACASIGAINLGEEVHAEVDSLGLLENDVVLGTALVDMYAKCDRLDKAQVVFDQLPSRDVPAWNALITAYAQSGRGNQALKCFKIMRDEGLSPNGVTFASLLKACSTIRDIEKGEEVHREVNRRGLLEKSVMLCTAVVDMYAKCGAISRAEEVFEELPARDVTTWTALIAGYGEHQLGEEALVCFQRMLDEGLFPNAVTCICILKACGCIGAVDRGKEIHVNAKKEGLLEKKVGLGSALVDMYAKCGGLVEAQEVFDQLPARDVVSWTALMAGYAQSGRVKIVFNSVQQMLLDDIEPNTVTFAILLSACSHAGLIEEGQMYFDLMTHAYNIVPSLEHHSCMVDLFTRAGNVDEVFSMIMKMPCTDWHQLWLALLGACPNWGNVGLGRGAFVYVLEPGESNAITYVSMSNTFVAAACIQEGTI